MTRLCKRLRARLRYWLGIEKMEVDHMRDLMHYDEQVKALHNRIDELERVK